MSLELPHLAAYVAGGFETSGEPFACENPATGVELCTLPTSDRTMVGRAVDAARTAFLGEWSTWSLGRRQRVLDRLADLLEVHQDEFSRLESAENGVPVDLVARFSVGGDASQLPLLRELDRQVRGRGRPRHARSGALDYVVPEPYGVVAILTAYNTPSLFLGSKVGPALGDRERRRREAFAAARR